MVLNKEVWKDVVGYEGIYQVSSLGMVKSLSREVRNGYNYSRVYKLEETILKNTFRGDYKIAILSKDGVKKSISIHRLVALTFIPNPNNLPQVNHKDEDKTNNRVDNLEWCTRKYNINYGTSITRRSNNRYKPIYKCDLHGNVIKRYDSSTHAKLDGYCNSNIIKCCKGKLLTYRGYKWRYANEND